MRFCCLRGNIHYVHFVNGIEQLEEIDLPQLLLEHFWNDDSFGMAS